MLFPKKRRKVAIWNTSKKMKFCVSVAFQMCLSNCEQEINKTSKKLSFSFFFSNLTLTNLFRNYFILERGLKIILFAVTQNVFLHNLRVSNN